MKDYKTIQCTNVQGKVNPIIKEALDNYQHIKCRCRRDNCWYEDNIRGIVLNKNLNGFYYVGIYGDYDDAIPIPKKQEIKYRLLPPEEAIPYLIMRGWEFDSKGNLFKQGDTTRSGFIAAINFNKFGKVISYNLSKYFPLSILEEVQEGEDDGDW